MTVQGTDRWTAFHGDTVQVAQAMPDRSVDFSVFSPPFAELYCYSNSERDMGNCLNYEQFFVHFDFLVKEQRRVMANGRNVAIHCMQIPTTITRYGYIGLIDFRARIVALYEKYGFIYHSEVVIWKNPVTQMQRTHALGLLHKQVLKDSAMSWQGLADYVVVMRTPGKNEKPIEHWSTEPDGSIKGNPDAENFEVERWQKYASPVWDDINPSDTLQHRSAREDSDEKHIAPLQLQVIERCIELWSRPDDVVWSPFMGIGSEGYVALQHGRRFVGAELKTSYYEQAVRNLREAGTVKQHALFQDRVFD